VLLAARKIGASAAPPAAQSTSSARVTFKKPPATARPASHSGKCPERHRIPVPPGRRTLTCNPLRLGTCKAAPRSFRSSSPFLLGGFASAQSSQRPPKGRRLLSSVRPRPDPARGRPTNLRRRSSLRRSPWRSYTLSIINPPQSPAPEDVAEGRKPASRRGLHPFPSFIPMRPSPPNAGRQRSCFFQMRQGAGGRRVFLAPARTPSSTEPGHRAWALRVRPNRMPGENPSRSPAA